MAKKRKRLPRPHSHVTTWELFRMYLASKLPQPKESAVDYNKNLLNAMPSDIQVNHLAIILDGRVEEVMRAQNRLTALLLSGPTFVEFDPKNGYPQVGVTEYRNGQFVNPNIDQEGNIIDVQEN